MPSNRFSTTRLLPTHTPALFAAAVEETAALLRRGEVVALPTETVYGLAANALDPAAVARLYEIKGRPPHNPIIVHVATADQARRCAARWPDAATKLATAFWPGPLTLVVERAGIVPDIVTAGGDTVGLRWPSHPFIQAVIQACGFPLAAPSANVSNELSPTNAEHVRRSLGPRLALIIDGGQSQVGIESTVVDVTQTPPRILRPGMIHLESILAVIASPASASTGATDRRSAEMASSSSSAPGERLRSPGLLERHYSPRAQLILMAWQQTDDLILQLRTAGREPGDCHIVAHTNIPAGERFASVHVIPHDAEAYARAIYAELHRCDDEGARCIVVEKVPDLVEWSAIADRLRRAAG